MMDKAQGSSMTLLPFVSKTYEMVDDPSTNSIVSWSASNRSFVIWDHPKFSRVLLRKFFKHDNFSSFIRQLNAYGFRKVDPNQWEFANDDFVRGQIYLLKNIKRRKPIHSHSLQNLQRHEATLPTDSERQSLKDEIEKLKHDKEQLLMELQIHEDERKIYEKQMHCSNDHLEKLEKKQQDMLSHVLQKHGIALNLSPLNENMDRKRRLPISGHFSDEAKQNAKSTPIFSLIMERMDQLESSIEFWENIAADIGDALVQGHSNLDFEKSINYAENPVISLSSLLLDVEVQPKPCESDMISEPAVAAAPDLSVSKDQSLETTHVPIGDNDLFWEHFFDIEPWFVRNSGSTIREKGLRWQKE